MPWIEQQDRVFYVVGVPRNPRLQEKIGPELKAMAALRDKTGHSQRTFRDFTWSTLSSWSSERRVIAKAEALAGKLNPRFVVTNLPSRRWSAKRLYEKLYCARGDMENRIKEHQLQLFSTRTSSTRMKANQLRLWLSTFAYLFYVVLRQGVWKDQEASRWEPNTIRLRVLKVAAAVTVSTRRVVVRLPRSYPWWEWFKAAI